MSDNFWKTCCHEAGHAILCVRSEIIFERVTVGPEEDDGEVHLIATPIDAPDDDWSINDLRTYRKLYAAGAAAEQLLFGNERDYGTKGDRICHAKVNALLDSSNRTSFEVDLESSKQLLGRDEITRVARALSDRRCLSFEDISEIIGASLPWDE